MTATTPHRVEQAQATGEGFRTSLLGYRLRLQAELAEVERLLADESRPPRGYGLES